LMMRVYPPGLSAIFDATSPNNVLTDSLFWRYENTVLLECVVSSLARVSKGSTYFLSAFALATVVVIRLLRINDEAIFESSACRCADFLPR
jgi:hypothetical protein